jgi:hypothetical protein
MMLTREAKQQQKKTIKRMDRKEDFTNFEADKSPFGPRNDCGQKTRIDSKFVRLPRDIRLHSPVFFSTFHLMDFFCSSRSLTRSRSHSFSGLRAYFVSVQLPVFFLRAILRPLIYVNVTFL